MTNHPLGDEIYTAYASGALSAPMRLLLDAQAAVNADVAQARDVVETMAGILLEQETPASMMPDALATLFDVIDSEEAGLGEAGPARFDSRAGSERSRNAASKAGQAIDELLNLPDPVRDLALDQGGWSFAGPGVRNMTLLNEDGAKAELIRIEPGRGVPHHGHDCTEFTLVLTGGFSDGRASYGPGEVCMANPDTIHKPVADEGEVCIVLAVTDGPLAFTGALGWIQRALSR
ncbi:transcriptional regulator [Oceanicaulis alexandrii HTCC2633]|uniref:cupin domain-containing protein n=1 Tax=Oceanicaulis sp. HTCC2633 TaxID=314254 RepID=UPI000066D327|nr:cupin domain-containing protein [Oceanicaulis sp. HTCC2633]EAP88760.1 transcriptional regulator [Oceanicaulis alexandrii HTCC2633] [Oceanicaulis sp. HTCC2633]